MASLSLIKQARIPQTEQRAGGTAEAELEVADRVTSGRIPTTQNISVQFYEAQVGSMRMFGTARAEIAPRTNHMSPTYACIGRLDKCCVLLRLAAPKQNERPASVWLHPSGIGVTGVSYNLPGSPVPGLRLLHEGHSCRRAVLPRLPSPPTYLGETSKPQRWKAAHHLLS